MNHENNMSKSFAKLNPNMLIANNPNFSNINQSSILLKPNQTYINNSALDYTSKELADIMRIENNISTTHNRQSLNDLNITNHV